MEDNGALFGKREKERATEVEIWNLNGRRWQRANLSTSVRWGVNFDLMQRQF